MQSRVTLPLTYLTNACHWDGQTWMARSAEPALESAECKSPSTVREANRRHGSDSSNTDAVA